MTTVTIAPTAPAATVTPRAEAARRMLSQESETAAAGI